MTLPTFDGYAALWRAGLAVVPVALLVWGLCRFGRLGPPARHALWLTTLVWFVAAMWLPGPDAAWVHSGGGGGVAPPAMGTLPPVPSDGPSDVRLSAAPKATNLVTEFDGPVSCASSNSPATVRAIPAIDAATAPPALEQPLPALSPSAAVTTPTPPRTADALESAQPARLASASPSGGRPSDFSTGVETPQSESESPTILDDQPVGVDSSVYPSADDIVALDHGSLDPVGEADSWSPDSAGETNQSESMSEPTPSPFQGEGRGEGEHANGVESPVVLLEPTKATNNAIECGIVPAGVKVPAIQPPAVVLAGQDRRLNGGAEVAFWRTWVASVLNVRDAVGRVPPPPAVFWWVGTILFVGWQVLRVAVGGGRMRRAVPADVETARLVAREARRLGVAQIPDVYFIDDAVSPLVWCGRRTRLILPRGLWRRLDDDGRRAVLCHELAHLRRRDHWVLWLEIGVGCLFWWHPILWWVRRRLAEEADLCCDAWVTWVLPRERRAYAEALLAATQFLGDRAGPRPLAIGMASKRAGQIAGRLTMIMTANRKPHVTVPVMLMAVLMSGVGWLVTPARSCPPEETPAPTTPPAVAVPIGDLPGTLLSPDDEPDLPAALSAPAAPSAPVAGVPGAHAFGRVYVSPAQGIAPVAGVAAAAPAMGEHGSDDRLHRIEAQQAALAAQLERLTAALDRLSQPAVPLATTPAGVPIPGSSVATIYDNGKPTSINIVSGDGVTERVFSIVGRQPIVSRTYPIPEDKIDLVWNLMAQEDVPVCVVRADDGIQVQATEAQQAIFAAFVKLITPSDAAEAVKLPKEKFEALEAIVSLGSVPTKFVISADNTMSVQGSPAEQAVFEAFAKLIHPTERAGIVDPVSAESPVNATRPRRPQTPRMAAPRAATPRADRAVGDAGSAAGLQELRRKVTAILNHAATGPGHGKFPANTDDLAQAGVFSRDALAGRGGSCDITETVIEINAKDGRWIYRHGRTESSNPSEAILAFRAPTDTQGAGFAFADGHVAYIGEPQASKMIERMRAGEPAFAAAEKSDSNAGDAIAAAARAKRDADLAAVAADLDRERARLKELTESGVAMQTELEAAKKAEVAARRERLAQTEAATRKQVNALAAEQSARSAATLDSALIEQRRTEVKAKIDSLTTAQVELERQADAVTAESDNLIHEAEAAAVKADELRLRQEAQSLRTRAKQLLRQAERIDKQISAYHDMLIELDVREATQREMEAEARHKHATSHSQGGR